MLKTIKVNVQVGQRQLYGELTLPDSRGPFPLVVYAHGYGYNFPLFDLKELARRGIATYFFDFGGGSPNSRSDGRSEEMSVMTESQELLAVIAQLGTRPEIDSYRIYLTGNSQGGYVATVAAATHPDWIQGMVLLCPAYVISSYAQRYFRNPFRRQKFRFGNLRISQRYYADLRHYDVFAEMHRFLKPVIIIHGDRDRMVPLQYAQRAAREFPQGHLLVASGAGHMLSGYTEMMVTQLAQLVLGKE
ncbi:alpha/beta hydrolase family protein [Levilactobacillus namurensis]|uniref:alpha/beta hydrolase family protein n=1 Tax=Levilactobacillus namurensis TaxID=380393 RepID=UPI001D2096F6|nr:alpha/beta fold hydrolase [Levilactobacillus namurensis]HJE45625.1 alpha/beta hydrolase [Levilactobacillus namurensis]